MLVDASTTCLLLTARQAAVFCYVRWTHSPPPLLAHPQLVPFTCFALDSLRPAVAMAAAESLAGAAVPALTRADIAVGDCLEFRLAADRSGQSAVYVPAVVVAAGVNAAPHKERRSRSIADVLERLHAHQPQQGAQQAQPDAAAAAAQGEPSAAGAAAAGVPASELVYQLVWPGAGQLAAQPGLLCVAGSFGPLSLLLLLRLPTNCTSIAWAINCISIAPPSPQA